MNRTLPKTKVHPDPSIRVYNVLVRPVLFYGSENWVLQNNTKSRITAAEMKGMQTIQQDTINRKRNEDMLKELKQKLILGWIKK